VDEAMEKAMAIVCKYLNCSDCNDNKYPECMLYGRWKCEGKSLGDSISATLRSKDRERVQTQLAEKEKEIEDIEKARQRACNDATGLAVEVDSLRTRITELEGEIHWVTAGLAREELAHKDKLLGVAKEALEPFARKYDEYDELVQECLKRPERTACETLTFTHTRDFFATAKHALNQLEGKDG